MCLSEYFEHFGIMNVLCRLQFPQLALRRRLGQLSCMSRPTVRLRSWPLSFLYYILPFGTLKPLAKVGWRPTSRVSTGGNIKESTDLCCVCVWVCKISLSRDINDIHQCVISVLWAFVILLCKTGVTLWMMLWLCEALLEPLQNNDLDLGSVLSIF